MSPQNEPPTFPSEDRERLRLSQPKSGPRWRYSVAIGLVIVATVLRLAFLQMLGMHVAFITFYPIVMLAALYGRLGPGLVATVLSAVLASYFWIEPAGSLFASTLADWVSIAIFLMSGAMVSGIVEAMYRARRRILEAEAEARVAAERALAADALRATEKALRESEERLHFALETNHTGAWDLDLVDHTAFRSLEHDRIFGYKELLPEWTYEMFLQHVEPEDCAEVDAKFREASATNGDWAFDCRIRRTDGEIRWIWAAGRHRTDMSGHRRVVGIVQDITGRKRAEENLRESEERFRIAFEDGALAMAMTGLDSKLQKVNLAFCRLLGYTEEEMVGHSFYEFTHPDDLVVNHAGIQRVFNGESPSFRMEKRYIRKDGEIVWVDMSTSIVRDSTGKPLHLVTHIQDITERKRAEEQLLQSREAEKVRRNELEILLETVPATVWIARDRECRTMIGNKAVYELLSMPEGSNVSQSAPEAERPHFLPYINGALVSMEDLSMHKAARTGEVTVGQEMEFRFANGTSKWVYGNAVPLRDKEGQITGALGAYIEITERKRAEEALRESERLYRAIGESINYGIWICDAQGRNTYASKSFLELVGITQEQCSEFGWGDVLHPDDVEGTIAAWKECVKGGGPWYREHRFRGADGQWHPILACGVPVRDERGNITAWAGINLDIGKLKKAEEALRESEDYFRTMANALPQLTWMARADGFIHWYNQRWYEYTGTTPEQMEGWGWQIVHDPKTLPRVLEQWKSSIATGQPFEMEFPLRRADGQFRQFLTRGYPLKDAKGRVVQWFGANTDVDDLKRAEEQLRELSQRLTYHVDNSPLAVIEWGSDMRLIRWSGEAEHIFGWKAAEVLGKRMEDFHWICTDDVQQVAGVSKELMTGTDPNRFSANRNYRKDGSIVYCEWYNSSLLDESGKLRSILSLVLDVTERKQAEERLRQTAEELARSNKDLEHFAYVAAHDLQEPLRTVRAFAQLLAKRYKGEIDADADEYIGFVVDGAGRMSNLVSGLLDYSRVSSAGQTLTPTDCEPALTEALSALHQTIAGANAEVTHDPMPMVLGDHRQLTQLFQNLIGNAIKFHSNGVAPCVHVGASEQDEQWIFSVRDNGIGIELQYHEKVFEIFRRLHGPQEYPGTGIGLALCKRIVERHAGRIWFESHPGEGTTFFFTLPKQAGRMPDR